MASSADFKKLYDLYQLEGVKKGISIVQFCKMNGIVYSHFERWYKQDRVANVVPVKIVDRDGLSVSPVDTIVSEELSSSGTDSFLSKNRRTLKIVRYENHKVILYDISYERGYSFMKPVFSEGEL